MCARSQGRKVIGGTKSIKVIFFKITIIHPLTQLPTEDFFFLISTGF